MLSSCRRNWAAVSLSSCFLFLFAWNYRSASEPIVGGRKNVVPIKVHFNSQKPSNDTSVQKVILSTYFRGGSTFLGEMINYNPEAFYMFEPLLLPFNYWNKKLKQMGSGKTMYFYPNGKEFPHNVQALHEMSDIILNILDCKFEKIDTGILGHYFHTTWTKAQKVIPYRNCHRKEVSDGLSGKEAVQKCRFLLKEACEHSKIRSVKVIRMAAMLTEKIVEKDPSVKIVYYTRDVRGMLVSRSGLYKKNALLNKLSLFEEEARHTCARVRHDMKTYSQLAHKFAVSTIKYEDLAMAPHDTVRELYDFIGSDVPAKVSSWIDMNTHAERSNGKLGTRRNSTAVAERWRGQLQEHHLEKVNLHCQDVLDYQGYPSF